MSKDCPHSVIMTPAPSTSIAPLTQVTQVTSLTDEPDIMTPEPSTTTTSLTQVTSFTDEPHIIFPVTTATVCESSTYVFVF